MQLEQKVKRSELPPSTFKQRNARNERSKFCYILHIKQLLNYLDKTGTTIHRKLMTINSHIFASQNLNPYYGFRKFIFSQFSLSPMAVFSLTLNSRHIEPQVRGASGDGASSLSGAGDKTGSGNSKK